MDSLFSDDRKRYLINVHENSKSSDRELVYLQTLDSDLAKSMGDSNVKIAFSIPKKSVKTINHSISQENENYDEELNKYKINREKLISLVGRQFGDSDHARRIQTACLWLYRSYINGSQLDSVLQSTIALEVLLGDRESSDRVGLSKLLANRCAYLLGHSDKSRNEILKTFEEVYKLRSSIVHSGFHYPKANDKRLLAAVRRLAGSVILRELELCRE